MRLYSFWRSSSTYRVRIVLHWKGVPFEYVPVNLLRGEQHAPEYRAKNPLGTVPALEVEDAQPPLLLAQSAAIAEYLEERFPTPPLFPRTPAARAQVRMLAEQVVSGIQPLQNTAVLKHVREALGQDDQAWATHWISAGLAALETLAARSAGRFLVGDDFSWADCCLVPQLANARRYHLDLSAYPLLSRVEQACLALDAVQRAAPDAQPDAQPRR